CCGSCHWFTYFPSALLPAAEPFPLPRYSPSKLERQVSLPSSCYGPGYSAVDPIAALSELIPRAYY
ncbi:hypothetical protein FS749_012083, partial [Ceratobasidium sp. UAMH 11750]